MPALVPPVDGNLSAVSHRSVHCELSPKVPKQPLLLLNNVIVSFLAAFCIFLPGKMHQF